MKKLIRKILKESGDYEFLGYHSTNSKFNNLDEGSYIDANYNDYVRETYYNLYSYDELLENSDYDSMADKLNEDGHTMLFVSDYVIESPNDYRSKYKYGDFLYKVYGKYGDYTIVDDPNEINASIITLYKGKKLKFKKLPDNYDSSQDEDYFLV